MKGSEAKSDRSHDLSSEEVERYSRQLLLPQFGVESQEKLKSSRVLVIGVGGLGCPASMYLAGAGVGTIGLVDRPEDVVEKSNLHRQVGHNEARVGTNKVESAAIAIRALNSLVSIEKHRYIKPSNAVKLVSSFDLVLDCTDNVMSRYLISDACATSRTPLISGAAIGLDGQLTMYCIDEDTPCYRCIFPTPPPPSCVGSCDSAGVLGPVPGIIGTFQALEALKILGGVRHCESLARKMLLFDASDSSFRTMKLRPRATTCLACGDTSSFKVADYDYEAFARGSLAGSNGTSWPPIDPQLRTTCEEFASMRKANNGYRLVDVRPAGEYDMCHLEEAESIPLSGPFLSKEFENMKTSAQKTVFICRRGNASWKALQLALEAGVKGATDVVGGLQSWHNEIDKSFPLY